jgi:hypothetical protein
VAFTVGSGTTLTRTLELLLQVPLLAVTEYVVFTAGLTRLVFVKTGPGVQVYEEPPFAVSNIELPIQTLGLAGTKEITGRGATSLFIVKVERQPLLLMPDTLYTVLTAGLTT